MEQRKPGLRPTRGNSVRRSQTTQPLKVQTDRAIRNKRPPSPFTSNPNRVKWAMIVPVITPNERNPPQTAVLGIKRRITATDSSEIVRNLPHGSIPSVRKICRDSANPQN
jgi:hypothetical protein